MATTYRVSEGHVPGERFDTFEAAMAKLAYESTGMRDIARMVVFEDKYPLLTNLGVGPTKVQLLRRVVEKRERTVAVSIDIEDPASPEPRPFPFLHRIDPAYAVTGLLIDVYSDSRLSVADAAQELEASLSSYYEDLARDEGMAVSLLQRLREYDALMGQGSFIPTGGTALEIVSAIPALARARFERFARLAFDDDSWLNGKESARLLKAVGFKSAGHGRLKLDVAPYPDKTGAPQSGVSVQISTASPMYVCTVEPPAGAPGGRALRYETDDARDVMALAIWRKNEAIADSGRLQDLSGDDTFVSRETVIYNPFGGDEFGDVVTVGPMDDPKGVRIAGPLLCFPDEYRAWRDERVQALLGTAPSLKR